MNNFTTTSHLIPCSSGECGSFDSVSASLYLYSTAHGVASAFLRERVGDPEHPFAVGGQSDPAGHDSAGQSEALPITQIFPAACRTRRSTQASRSGLPSVLRMPTPSLVLDLEQAFTNTSGIITSYDPVTMKPAAARQPRASIRSTTVAGTPTSFPGTWDACGSRVRSCFAWVRSAAQDGLIGPDPKKGRAMRGLFYCELRSSVPFESLTEIKGMSERARSATKEPEEQRQHHRQDD